MLSAENSKRTSISNETLTDITRNAAFMITKEVALPVRLRGDRDDQRN